MRYYGQNLEDKFVYEYFRHNYSNNYKGTVLDIGANTGEFLSNSLALINDGWFGWLLEPGATFSDLQLLYKDNPMVECYNYGIGKDNEIVRFWESGCHIPYGSDKGLVSTTSHEETDRWRKAGVEFIETRIKLSTFDTFWQETGYIKFDFISIDAESNDKIILEQIDLDEVGCKCLCIEHNGDPFLIESYIAYCGKFGMKEALRNNENQIFVR